MNIRYEIQKKINELNNKEYIFEKKNEKYEGIRFNEFIYKVKALSTYLIENKLKNKNIIVIGKNSINYLISDAAVTIYTGTCININHDTKIDDLNDMIIHLKVEAIIYTNDQKEKIEAINNIFKVNVDEIIDNLKEVKDNYKKLDIDECSKIFFSSGTTSKPKGIKLSLKNVFAGWDSLKKRTPFTSEDIIYLFLPLHHTYANIYNFYYSFLSGLSIYLSSGVKNIIFELKDVNPTIFCGVPLIYERIYEYTKDNLKESFGKNIKYLYCGGALLNIEIRDIYKENGLEILNAYALTETASSFAIDYPGSTNDDAVGTLFENMKFKVIEQDENGVGEICCKGDSVFLGYTTEVDNIFTEDKYFKTGDLGYIKNNKIYIKGRKKKVLVGSNGENIYPDEIEAKLKELDNNINHVNVRLNNNKIEVILYLENKYKTNTDNLIEIYNSKCVQKNKIYKYEVSNNKNYEKMINN